MKRDYSKLTASVVWFLVDALLLMFLWNALFPALLGAGRMSYWQALGVVLLWQIVFGGWRLKRIGDEIIK